MTFLRICGIHCYTYLKAKNQCPLHASTLSTFWPSALKRASKAVTQLLANLVIHRRSSLQFSLYTYTEFQVSDLETSLRAYIAFRWTSELTLFFPHLHIHLNNFELFLMIFFQSKNFKHFLFYSNYIENYNFHWN